MDIREQTEELERQILSPRATLAAESRGRLRSEQKCSIRTDFQRDRDRIIHCKAFRRLKYKTQVFIDPEEDHFRTRLTHTLEVSQIARTIARALRLNEDLTEAISLGHDLGHTPFGHAGETALDEALREIVPGARFRHSEQSLRVVDVLEKKGLGLNLTWEVRDGILHHSKGRDDLDLDTLGPATPEGQIVRTADRVAYVNHDIDDAIRAGLITEDSLPERTIGLLGETHSRRIDNMVHDIIESSLASNRIAMSEPFRQAANELKDFLFQHVYELGPSGIMRLSEARRVLKELFRYYVEHPQEMPIPDGIPIPVELENLARTACDFVAGMTDRYALQRYNECVSRKRC